MDVVPDVDDTVTISACPDDTETFILQTQPSASLAPAALPTQGIVADDAPVPLNVTDNQFVTDVIDNESFQLLESGLLDPEGSNPGSSTDYDTASLSSDASIVTGGLPPSLTLDDMGFDLLDTNSFEELDPDWDPCTMLDALGMGKTRDSGKPRRHSKGPKRQRLEDLPEANRKNVERCREYRKEKNSTLASWLDELETLEARNMELKKQEQEMRGKVDRFQTAYLKLISDGKIKFFN